jgi:signal transduction histidine kinase
MFLSRIEDTDKLSEKSREYMAKSNEASQRMQSLIKNLLTYSRIDNTGDDFEKIDLQEVVEKTVQDFANEFEENHITVTYENLPTINGVLFQMEQLFTNLISNSIKYRSSKVAPIIIIEATKIHRNQIAQDFLKNHIQYYKITLADNGIGFDQENAEDVFEIFKRLHQKHEYSGTGIGLAICKKIVENHQGYIFVTSQLGIGTTFTIYLPA